HKECIGGMTLFDSITPKQMGIETLHEFHIRQEKEIIETREKGENVGEQSGATVGAASKKDEMEREGDKLTHTVEIQGFDDESASRPQYVTYEEFDSLSRSMDILTTSVAGLHTKLDDMMEFLKSRFGTPPPPPPSNSVYHPDDPTDDIFMEF
ncbi:unnamed protein product, partial [Ilex paraguariensis]